jgi:bifunctional oligoribonuclease and PAP phosphatase NrnA
MAIYDPKKLPFEVELLEQVKDLFEQSKKIVIISHRSPDGDTVGANLALKHGLEQWGKTVVSACIDPPPEYSLILNGSYEFVNDFELSEFDLIMAVDCGSHELIRFHETKPEIFDKKIPFINIDHHPSNDFFGTHNLVHDTAAAAVFTVYHLIKYLKINITREMATALMMGLYYDTGSFMHSNTDKNVMEMAADLLNLGADMKRIVKTMFHTTPVEQLKLWGRIMTRARVTDRHAVVSAVTQKDFEECGAKQNATNGVIDFLNSVPEGKFSVLLNEDQKGNIKGSLRTQQNDIDLSKMASLFGGGGHRKAAGFSVKGRLQQELTWKIVEPNNS